MLVSLEPFSYSISCLTKEQNLARDSLKINLQTMCFVGWLCFLCICLNPRAPKGGNYTCTQILEGAHLYFVTPGLLLNTCCYCLLIETQVTIFSTNGMKFTFMNVTCALKWIHWNLAINICSTITLNMVVIQVVDIQNLSSRYYNSSSLLDHVCIFRGPTSSSLLKSGTGSC